MQFHCNYTLWCHLHGLPPELEFGMNSSMESIAGRLCMERRHRWMMGHLLAHNAKTKVLSETPSTRGIYSDLHQRPFTFFSSLTALPGSHEEIS